MHDRDEARSESARATARGIILSNKKFSDEFLAGTSNLRHPSLSLTGDRRMSFVR